MNRYTVTVSERAQRQLGAIRDAKLRGQLEAAIDALADEPRPGGVKKLQGEDDAWRVRVRTWRIIYTIEDDRLVVLVVSVAKRDEVYR